MENTPRIVILCFLLIFSAIPTKANAGFLFGYLAGNAVSNSSNEKTIKNLQSENDTLKEQVKNLTKQLATEKEKNKNCKNTMPPHK